MSRRRKSDSTDSIHLILLAIVVLLVIRYWEVLLAILIICAVLKILTMIFEKISLYQIGTN